MTLDESKTENDIVDEYYGVSIVTDSKLSPYLEGAMVDYVESRYGGGFEIRTGRESDSCGGDCCG